MLEWIRRRSVVRACFEDVARIRFGRRRRGYVPRFRKSARNHYCSSAKNALARCAHT